MIEREDDLVVSVEPRNDGGVIQADRQLAAVLAAANGFAWTAQMYADGLLDDDEIMTAIVEYRANITSETTEAAARLIDHQTPPPAGGPLSHTNSMRVVMIDAARSLRNHAHLKAPATNPHQEDTTHDT